MHNITIDKNYISLGWTDIRQLLTDMLPRTVSELSQLHVQIFNNLHF